MASASLAEVLARLDDLRGVTATHQAWHNAPAQQLQQQQANLKGNPKGQEPLHALAAALHAFLKNGLQGNRTVSSGSVWSMVTAATRAFPIQLSPSVEKAQAVVDAEDTAAADLVHTWLVQAAADGSLALLVQKLRSQPQILTAYSRDAPIRNMQTVGQLMAVLLELQTLIPVSPYDKMQQHSQAAPATPSERVHVQTEEDAAQHMHHQQQQQQQPQSQLSSSSPSASSSADGGQGICASSSSSSAACSTSGSNQDSSSSSNTPRQQPEGQQQQQKQGLYQRLRSARLPQLGSFSKKTAAVIKHTDREQQCLQQQLGEDCLLRVQLHAVPCGASSESDKCVQLQIEYIQPSSTANNDQRQADGVQHDSSSSTAQHVTSERSRSTPSPSKLLKSSESVKGLLHGLQQSAASGLQQSAAATAAAGQELSGAVAAAGGAVAAAGGAVAAAIGSPFVVVKGLAGRAARGKDSNKPSTENTDSGAAGAAGAATAASKSFTLQGSASKHRIGNVVQADRVAVEAGSTWEAEPMGPLQVQLLVRHPSSGAQDQLQFVKLAITVITAAAAADGATKADSSSRQGQQAAASRDGWSTRVLLNKLRMASGSSGSRESSQQSEVIAPAVAGAAAAAAAAAGGAAGGGALQQQQQQQQQDVLEGDMWSVMARLRSSSISAAKATAAAAGPSARSAAADDAAAKQLQEAGQVLLQQLVACCQRVTAAAAATKGCMGEESTELLHLVELTKALLNHGLVSSGSSSSVSLPSASAGNGSSSSSSSSRGHTPEPGGVAGSSPAAAAKATAASAVQGMTARGVLGGLLSNKQQSAFAVLQSLQHGRKQQPRLMLGADGIANMKAARSASPSVKLDLWVRASLNEQLLGCRLSTLLANPDAISSWYHPQALLLQHQAMADVMQQLSELSDHKFALPVESSSQGYQKAPGLGAAGKGAGSRAAAPAAAGAAAGGVAGAVEAHSLSSRSSSAAAAAATKLLGGFSMGLGALRTASAHALGQEPPPAAAAATAEAGPSSGGSSSSSSNSNIPTFLWGGLGGSSSGPATAGGSSSSAAVAAGDVVSAGNSGRSGGFFRRRLVQINEVRVPPPNTGAVLSREPSSTLSPMSTADDVAYAEWWSPNNSWQDLEGAGKAATADGQGLAQGGSPCSAAADAAAADALRQPNSSGSQGSLGSGRSLGACGRLSRGDSDSSPYATSEAALKLEADLEAAMNAPLHGLSRSASAAGSASGGLQMQSSSGWDAAVAAARARSGHLHRGQSGGLYSSVELAAVNGLHRRSKSPEPHGSQPYTAGGVMQRRSGRHMHKRSSSLNDLPELEALLMETGGGQSGS